MNIDKNAIISINFSNSSIKISTSSNSKVILIRKLAYYLFNYSIEVNLILEEFYYYTTLLIL